MATHAEWQTNLKAIASNNNDVTTLSPASSCEIVLIHPDNEANVNPIYHQENYIILMDWEDYVSPEGYDISYTLEIWNKIEPSKIDYYQLSDSYKYLIVDHLQTYDTFIWQVTAMNLYGEVCQSQKRSFVKTDPSAGNAGISYVFLKDANSQNVIANASIQPVLSTYKIKIFQPDINFFHVEGPYGKYLLNAIAWNYHSKQIEIDHTFNKHNPIFLTKRKSLEDLIKILRILSGFPEKYDCLNEIDLCMNKTVDFGDAIYLMNKLAQ